MRVLIISNDVISGFGVPVAAPGLRAMGLAAGLTAHGHDVSTSVPSDLLALVFGDEIPPAPDGVDIVSPPDLMAHIEQIGADTVVFINSNLSPHLHPTPGVTFVYDPFAPKLLEGLASTTGGRPFAGAAAEKERALALADHVWVNGRRKMGYALGWLLRDEVDRIRTEIFAKPSLRDRDVANMITLVEMPVSLPETVEVSTVTTTESPDPVRLGLAGYAQAWSTLSEVALGHRLMIDAGHALHALTPQHWAGNPDDAPRQALPPETILHDGPLPFDEFARWVQSMDAMVDLFEPSAERAFAMITRSAVALRLGVPLIHAVDSEISDVIEFYDAGWVLDPHDHDRWNQIAVEVADPSILTRKQQGARRVSLERFAPHAALAEASARLQHAT